jgi:sugar lactone lactonase YvrE
MDQVVCRVASCDQLGEGPCWDAKARRLYWFDIKGLTLHWLDPVSDETGAWPLPVQASAAAPRAKGGLVLATNQGLALFDTETGTLDLHHPLAAPEGFRVNDGKIGVHGRFFWSHMDDAAGQRGGKLFCTGPDWTTRVAVDQVHIANAVSCSPDGRTFYLADSAKRTLYAYDLDPTTGDLSNPRVFTHVEGQTGTPDGAAVDAEGFVWSCHWGGWRVVRYAPDGSIDRVIDMPVEQPTSCAFGGEDLETLFVTSAWDGLSAEARAVQPLAGCLFSLEPGVRGLALPAFEG